jgi:hypothetical protein
MKSTCYVADEAREAFALLDMVPVPIVGVVVGDVAVEERRGLLAGTRRIVLSMLSASAHG